MTGMQSINNGAVASGSVKLSPAFTYDELTDPISHSRRNLAQLGHDFLEFGASTGSA